MFFNCTEPHIEPQSSQVPPPTQVYREVEFNCNSAGLYKIVEINIVV